MFDSNRLSMSPSGLSVEADRPTDMSTRPATPARRDHPSAGSFSRRSPMSSISAAPQLRLGPVNRPRRHADAPQAPARLARRGRVTMVVVFLALAFALFTALGPHSAATGQRGTPVPTRTV